MIEDRVLYGYAVTFHIKPWQSHTTFCRLSSVVSPLQS